MSEYVDYGPGVTTSTRDRTHTLFGQTMGLVAITTGFFALGGYLTADGDEVLLAVQNEAEWARLCGDVLGLPDMLNGRFAGNQRRIDQRDEVERRLAAAVARLPTGELLERLERAGLPYGSAKSVHEVAAHPQLASR